MDSFEGSTFQLCVMIGAALAGFLAGVVVGWKLNDEPTYTNPTDPRTRPSDYPTENAGFGPDYPWRKEERRRK